MMKTYSNNNLQSSYCAEIGKEIHFKMIKFKLRSKGFKLRSKGSSFFAFSLLGFFSDVQLIEYLESC